MEAKIKSIVKSIAWKYFGTALYIIVIVAGIGPLYLVSWPARARLPARNGLQL